MVFLRREESDVVAEAWSLDLHEVGAGAGFFDEGDAVGGVVVAVELVDDVSTDRIKDAVKVPT